MKPSLRRTGARAILGIALSVIFTNNVLSDTPVQSKEPATVTLTLNSDKTQIKDPVTECRAFEGIKEIKPDLSVEFTSCTPVSIEINNSDTDQSITSTLYRRYNRLMTRETVMRNYIISHIGLDRETNEFKKHPILRSTLEELNNYRAVIRKLELDDSDGRLEDRNILIEITKNLEEAEKSVFSALEILYESTETPNRALNARYLDAIRLAEAYNEHIQERESTAEAVSTQQTQITSVTELTHHY